MVKHSTQRKKIAACDENMEDDMLPLVPDLRTSTSAPFTNGGVPNDVLLEEKEGTDNSTAHR